MLFVPRHPVKGFSILSPHTPDSLLRHPAAKGPLLPFPTHWHWDHQGNRFCVLIPLSRVLFIHPRSLALLALGPQTVVIPLSRAGSADPPQIK